MAIVADWLRPPDFLGASEAGYRLGLSRQEMLQQAEQHAAELALRADEIRARNSQEQAQRQQEQGNFNAGLALRREALKQQGLLGEERLGNEADRTATISDLNRARIDELNRKGALEIGNANARALSLQNIPELMQSHPDMTKPEILARFPLLKADEIPSRAKPAAVKPLYPPGVQDQLFKQLLLNSRGGTNVDDAISGLNRYMQPQDSTDEPAAAPDESAGASLGAPTAESVDGLDVLTLPPKSPGGTKIWDKATGRAMIYGGDPNDIPLNRFSLTPPGQ